MPTRYVCPHERGNKHISTRPHGTAWHGVPTLHILYGCTIRSCNSAGAFSYSFTTVEVRVP